jgi:uncharacterized membrane protein
MHAFFFYEQYPPSSSPHHSSSSLQTIDRILRWNFVKIKPFTTPKSNFQSLTFTTKNRKTQNQTFTAQKSNFRCPTFWKAYFSVWLQIPGATVCNLQTLTFYFLCCEISISVAIVAISVLLLLLLLLLLLFLLFSYSSCWAVMGGVQLWMLLIW